MDCLQSLFLLSALFALSFAECGPDGLNCCLSEFLTLVSPMGIKLSEKSLAASCMIREDTQTCIADYSDQCVAPGNDKMQGAINKTTDFIETLCSSGVFATGVKEYEDCYQNASISLQTCYNKTVLPEEPKTDDKSKWKAECCGYQDLQVCTMSVIKDSCGSTAMQLAHDIVMNINGAAFEVACDEEFKECGNSGVALASSLFITLASVYSIYVFLRFL